ncbi:MAG: hypothetical protein RLZZ58_2153 [Pseudomonadota bacterium]
MTGGPALILGASGQDGTLVARQLRGDGVVVHGTGRRLADRMPDQWGPLGLADGVHRHSVDLDDAAAVLTLIDHVRPDQIYCLSGQSSVGRSFAEPEATRRSHVAPMVNVAEAVKALRIDPHIMLAGSGEVFGETSADAPATESSPMAPASPPPSPYAAAKAEAIQRAQQYRDDSNVRISVAHLFGHESPLRRADFVFGKVIGAILNIRAGRIETLSLGRGDVVRDWGWAPDYADAMIRMAARDDPVDLIIATGTSVSLQSAVAALFAAAGLDAADHVTFGDTAFARPTEARTMYADPSAARAVIDWKGSTPFPGLATLLLRNGIGAVTPAA